MGMPRTVTLARVEVGKERRERLLSGSVRECGGGGREDLERRRMSADCRKKREGEGIKPLC